MKCPHCLENYYPFFEQAQIQAGVGHDHIIAVDGEHQFWFINACQCPACKKFIILLERRDTRIQARSEIQVWPKGVARSALPPEIPDAFANDYREACIVLSDSPKASAALSRRCLQHILREKGGTKKRDLFDQIAEVIPTLPSHLAEAIDAVRNIGNFAAHPMKSTNSGEILDVETGEAEWNLEVIEGLFDFYFVQPAVLQKKRELLNKRLAEAGKPPMK
jgi:hypothetical protein